MGTYINIGNAGFQRARNSEYVDKSLLVSTLAAVFEGRRDLFEAFTTEQGIEQPQLFIATTDW